MKRIVVSFICGLAIAALSSPPAFAAPPNINGMWTVQQTGRNGMSTGTITVQQSGNGFVAQNAKNGTGFTGEFVSDSKINGKWHGPQGAGWLTIYVTPNGHSFNGTWGYNGREANGSFIGNKVLPPSPITAAGMWNVALAGGPAVVVGPMSCTQSGPTAVCKAGDVVINGAFRAKDKVTAQWRRGNAHGWFSFWFNGDNNSFNGVWGYGTATPGQAPVGRVVGQRSLSGGQ